MEAAPTGGESDADLEEQGGGEEEELGCGEEEELECGAAAEESDDNEEEDAAGIAQQQQQHAEPQERQRLQQQQKRITKLVQRQNPGKDKIIKTQQKRQVQRICSKLVQWQNPGKDKIIKTDGGEQVPRIQSPGAALRMPGKAAAAVRAPRMPAEADHTKGDSASPFQPQELRTPAPSSHSKNLKESASEANRVLSCPPSQASPSLFKFQNPLMCETDQFPENDKMNQSATGLNSEVLDYILPVIIRGRTEVDLCYADSWSELGDRIHMGALFPGLRYFTSPDQDMMAELTDCYYTVQKRDAKGDIILDEDGQPITVRLNVSPPKCDLGERHENHQQDDKKKWVVDFSTYVKNSNTAEWRPDYKEEDLWQEVSLLEAKFMLEKNAIYQAGMSGCNNMLKSLKESRLVDRLYAFAAGRDEYNYCILDGFGVVDVVDNTITPESYMIYEDYVECLKNRLGDKFYHESYRMIPRDLISLQKMYDHRRREFRMLYGLDFPGDPRRLLIGVFYCNRSMIRTFYSGRKPVSIKEAHGFIQGLMRIHVGNNFLNWTIEKAQSIFRKRSQENSQKSRAYIDPAPFFSQTIRLSEDEIVSPSNQWKFTKDDDMYTISLETPDFSGSAGSVRAGAVLDPSGGRKVVLMISKSQQKIAEEYPLYIDVPGDVDEKKVSFEGGLQKLLIFCPRKCISTDFVWNDADRRKRKERVEQEGTEQALVCQSFQKKFKGERLDVGGC